MRVVISTSRANFSCSIICNLKSSLSEFTTEPFRKFSQLEYMSLNFPFPRTHMMVEPCFYRKKQTNSFFREKIRLQLPELKA